MPLMLVSVVLFLWLTVLEQRCRRPFAKSRYKNYNRDYGYFSESIQAVQPIVQYGQTGHVLDQYQRIQSRIVEDGLTEARIANRYGFRRNMVLSVARRICQGLWIWQLRNHVLDAAMIMYLNMLTEQLLASFFGSASLLERIYDGLEPTRLLINLLHEKPSVADHPASTEIVMPPAAEILLKNVTFSYPKRETPVLREFSLSVAPGMVLGIVGRSGCGKTTIQNLLTRIFDVQQGSVEICGADVRL